MEYPLTGVYSVGVSCLLWVVRAICCVGVENISLIEWVGNIKVVVFPSSDHRGDYHGPLDYHISQNSNSGCPYCTVQQNSDHQ